ncbi:CYTH and CHAD domain-containing protein [Sphingosinicella sp. BN140058]|uniref:CYTH and CHAD domain-containing protein n=1 Tax=Sphingosinicella sp. BN140058 TaxID=1892855 RepID=UPI001011ED69|nr:CYTH and CHAD domain-containing protein [Sphingosinicella sp. BN140058]QAY76480.1 CYTH and CHAD domain-containing protein [Sphingosinicella sp. BN140058]
MTETEEVELKLELVPGDVERFRALALLGAPSHAAQPQVSTYFDTPEGHVRKAGYSLRIRRKGRRHVQTVKAKGGEAGGFSARAEWEQGIDGPTLDFEALGSTPLAPLLARKKVRARLQSVSETRVDRTTWLLRRDGSTIELILDVGAVVVGDRSEPVCEIELELKRGSRAGLFAFAREIGRDIPLRMGVLSKSERGQRLGAKRPRQSRKAENVEVPPGTTIADAFALIVQSCLRHFRRNELAAIADRDAEAVHQLRVAIRRLRSAFTLFRPVAASDEFDRLRVGFGALSALLGEARDLDVTLAGLRGTTGAGKAATAERQRLKTARGAAYDMLVATLTGEDLPRLILDLVAFAEVGAWRETPRAQRSIEAFAEERLGRLWRKVRKQGKDIAAIDPDARHQLRIQVKKLRYGSEFFAELALGSAKRWTHFNRLLEALQEDLGKLNDLETARTVAPAAPAAHEAEALLIAAQRAADGLREAGPYWR